MKLLLDTHLLLWAARMPDRLSTDLRALLAKPGTQPLFSAASIWEVAIKATLRQADFQVDARRLRQGLLENGYEELPILSRHARGIADLPPIHRDPFDRLLVAQAWAEDLPLLTADPVVARYPGPIQLV